MFCSKVKVSKDSPWKLPQALRGSSGPEIEVHAPEAKNGNSCVSRSRFWGWPQNPVGTVREAREESRRNGREEGKRANR